MAEDAKGLVEELVEEFPIITFRDGSKARVLCGKNDARPIPWLLYDQPPDSMAKKFCDADHGIKGMSIGKIYTLTDPEQSSKTTGTR